MNNEQNNYSINGEDVQNNLAKKLGGVALTAQVKKRPDGNYLIFEMSYPTDRFFAALEEVNRELDEDHPFRDRLSIHTRNKQPTNRLETPETQLFRREISESLTVDSNTFGENFLKRYTPSVTNHEEQIVSKGNFLVYGRRGAGKSSLLAYDLHHLKDGSDPFAWIAMQTYSRRADLQAVASVFAEIFRELRGWHKSATEIDEVITSLDELAESELSALALANKLTRITPRLRRTLGTMASPKNPIVLFLDDVHLVDQELQPVLLGMLYSLTRDNSIYIKASAIEQLCVAWNPLTQQGLQAPHDVQILRLDYNLTMPDRSMQHIEGILDGHAKYCGLPSIRYLADGQAISRLVLVAAAVPRDALSLFSQAISKALTKSQKAVTITSINAAASDAAEEKIKDVGKDAPADKGDVNAMLIQLKEFCIKEKRTNSFLVKIESESNNYKIIQRLVALRLVHVLHEGITPHHAGERFQALMLDFGFYVGIRAARSVRLFPSEPIQLLAKELRKLPIFTPS